MNRRDFFKKSSISISAAALAGITAGSFSDLYAKREKNSKSFSFEIITDKPDEAIKLSEEFFRKYSFNDPVINFSEYPATGNMSGDIVFIKDGKLINYKDGTDMLNKDIRLIAGALSLPKVLINPSRLRFYVSENTIPAEKFLVFHKNVLVRSILAKDKNSVLNIEGTKGNVLLNIENNKARVISSTCTHKTCINSGSIAFSGENIVCIPNELMILCE